MKKTDYVYYLSGPMRGYPDFNYPLFNQIARYWRRKGYKIVNPAESFKGRKNLPIKQYARRDTSLIINKCSAILLLPGWKDSVGSMAEYYLACMLGYPAFHAMTMQPITDQSHPKEQPVSLTDKIIKILKEGLRRKEYDEPFNDFGRTAAMLTGLGYRFEHSDRKFRNIQACDLPIIQTCVKLSRLSHRLSNDYFHEDSAVDVCGYMGTLPRIRDATKKRK